MAESSSEEEMVVNERAFLGFPWKSTKWPVILEHFQQVHQRWEQETEATTASRLSDLQGLLNCYQKSYPALPKLQAEFYAPDGPLKLMVSVVVNGESIFPAGQEMTRKRNSSTLSLTKLQAFTICSLSFFNLFDRYHYAAMFSGPALGPCMANYFIRMVKENQADSSWFDKQITIERRVLGQSVPEPDWRTSEKTLCGLAIAPSKVGIEDQRDSYQVNFADPYPGGTLPSAHGDIVQEEILFLIYPELFITPLLVDRIETEEAVIVSGITRTNKYKGYQWSFTFDGDYTNDSNDVSIIFMDALPGGASSPQAYLRELNKAFLGFSCNTHGKSIATGHWGCGAFGGNTELKALIQLMAAAEAGRDLVYVPHSKSIEGLEEVYSLLKEKSITVGTLYEILLPHILPKAGSYWGSCNTRYFKVVKKALRAADESI